MRTGAVLAAADVAPSSVTIVVFVLLAMSAAALAHLAWLKSALSRRFAHPIDCGATWRGHRLFGANKQWRGLMMLPPAAALSFAAGAWLAPAAAPWAMPLASYALLGGACGTAFMLAELPNSFLKRQLGVAPASKRARRRCAGCARWPTGWTPPSACGSHASCWCRCPRPPVRACSWPARRCTPPSRSCSSASG